MFAPQKKQVPPPAGSPKYGLSLEDLQKIGKGAVIAGLGAVSAYLVTQANQADFSTSQGIFLAAVCSVLANLLHKYLSDTTK